MMSQYVSSSFIARLDILVLSIVSPLLQTWLKQFCLSQVLHIRFLPHCCRPSHLFEPFHCRLSILKAGL